MTSCSDVDDSKKMEKLFQQLKSKDQKKGTDWRLCFTNLLGVAACLVSAILRGLVPATSRYVQDRGYTAYQIILFSDALVLLVALFIVVYHRTNILPTDINQGVRLVFQGATRLLGMIFLFKSYKLMPPAQVEAIYDASAPVFVLMLSCIFVKENPTRATILGSLWCIAGVILLGYGSFVNKSPSADTKDVVLAIVLTVIGSLFFSIYAVGGKILLEYTPRATIVTYTNTITTVSAGIAACFTSSLWRLDPLTATVLASTCISLGLGILFYYFSLKLVEVNAVIALLQFRTVIAYCLQWAILGFAPTIYDGLGVTCILIGTFSIVIWEVIVRRKQDQHRTLMKELDLKATS